MRAERYLMALLALSACVDHTFEVGLKLADGKVISPEVLNQGKTAYTLYCRACHGDRGDGTGPASHGYRPPPRDFTTGLFKFAAVAPGGLPRDTDLRRVIRFGLHGTAMLPWEIDDSDLDAVIQYLKTFSPRWQEELPGEAIDESPDPWRPAASDDALSRGKKVYHGLAQCLSCHPAYASAQYVAEASRELSGAATALRPAPYLPLAKETDYVDRNAAPDAQGQRPHLKLLAPDFLLNELRSVRDLHDPATSGEDLYRSIAAGVSGTAMPQWQGALSERDLWALVHYVRWLALLRETPGAAALRHELGSQPAAGD